ncbi:RNA polymerase factor sigma-54 [Lachnospiraceae bacterium ZAX-1]
MGLEQVMNTEQRQVMSSNQIQSLEILQYTNQELKDFLAIEYLENPMLDNVEDRQDDMIKDIESVYEKSTSYKEHSIAYGEEDSNRNNDIIAADKDEIKNYFLWQLHKKDFDHTEWDVMGYLIDCLDDNGFFTYEVDELAKTLNIESDIVAHALATLKNLEPVGIFSKNIAECLLRQLEAKGLADDNIRAIIVSYLPDILSGRISTVSRSMSLSTIKIKEYLHLIGTLNPRPSMNISKDMTEYIIPDIIASYDNGTFFVTLNDNYIGEYKFNNYYIHMMECSKDEELLSYFKSKLERTRFIVASIEQRRLTITNVVHAILTVQTDYFIHNGRLKPMSMEDIARKLDISISTVSRAIKNKYLQYKSTILLKDLFTSSASNEGVSVNTLKDRVAEIVSSENKSTPLSDQKIADIMRGENIPISRRTVTKYRQLLGIPDGRQRKYL